MSEADQRAEVFNRLSSRLDLAFENFVITDDALLKRKLKSF